MLDWSTFEAESLDIVRRSYTLGDTKERFAWRTVPDSVLIQLNATIIIITYLGH